jgi:hypothetical protein
MPSSVIGTYYYNEKEKTLTIIFTSGNKYQYQDVPERIYRNLQSSSSKGIFFNREIKGIYSFKKIR